MKGIVDKLADVTQRIADCEGRIAEQWNRMASAGYHDMVEAATLAYLTDGVLRELRTYKAHLERELRR